MKFNFIIQQYQTDAARSVVGVFKGQPYSNPVNYRRDIGKGKAGVSYSQMSFADSMYEQQELALTDDYDDAGFKNEIVALPDAVLLSNIREIQQNIRHVIDDFHHFRQKSKKSHQTAYRQFSLQAEPSSCNKA